MQFQEIIDEAEKSNSALTKALLKKVRQLVNENQELEKQFNEEEAIKSNQALKAQLDNINQEIKEQGNTFRQKLAEQAMRNPETLKLCNEEQKILAVIKAQKDNNARYIEALENINIQISNLNGEKIRRDNIINDFYEQKSNYEILKKELEEKVKQIQLYGPEAEKTLQKVAELEPQVRNIKKAIDDVEPAIKQIWDLLENDNFDASVGHNIRG